MDSTYSQIIPEYDINKDSENSNGQEMIPIGSDFEADVLLIQIHDHKMEKDRIIKLFEKETSHIKAWKDQEITKLDKKIQWLSQHLEVFLVSSESERLNLPHGKVSYRKQPFHVEVLDENKLISGGIDDIPSALSFYPIKLSFSEPMDVEGFSNIKVYSKLNGSNLLSTTPSPDSLGINTQLLLDDHSLIFGDTLELVIPKYGIKSIYGIDIALDDNGICTGRQGWSIDQDSLVYQIPVQSLGDYNLNDAFDCFDIFNFIDDYNTTTYGFQMGPSEGVAPHYHLLEDDNHYDIHDLIVFKTLYNYTLIQNGEISCNDLLFTSDPGLLGPSLLSIEEDKLYLQLDNGLDLSSIAVKLSSMESFSFTAYPIQGQDIIWFENRKLNGDVEIYMGSLSDHSMDKFSDDSSVLLGELDYHGEDTQVFYLEYIAWDRDDDLHYTARDYEEVEIIPDTFSLNQVYPNPFNPSVMISYQLPVETRIELRVYDINGNKVTTLWEGLQAAGNYSIEWNAEGYPSGVYFVKLNAGEFTQTQKLMLVK